MFSNKNLIAYLITRIKGDSIQKKSPCSTLFTTAKKKRKLPIYKDISMFLLGAVSQRSFHRHHNMYRTKKGLENAKI